MSDRWCFGRFELRPTERQLLADGAPTPLGARAFDLLLALHARRDRTVPKSELMDVVWPGLIVEENNLQVQVSALRKLLGPQAIATIPGRGYRFAMAPAPATTPPDPTEPPRAPTHRPELLGRADDLLALRALCEQHALVTVTGAGGIGKTRLAQALLLDEPHGALPQATAWVELAPLVEPALVLSGIAAACGVQLPPGVDPLAALSAQLAPRVLQLGLDNAEHLVEEVARVVQALLERAPRLRLLVTSQLPLRLVGEQVYRLAPLACAPRTAALDAAMRFGAVALFVQRAQQAERHFSVGAAGVPLLIDICRRLDGVALAIELAAARAPLLGLTALAARLDERFRLLTAGRRDAPSRQQTLHATFDWSYRLLLPTEQLVFRRLGVFAGGFTLALAQAVIGGEDGMDEWAVIDALGALVDRSLVSVEGGEAPRYRLLESGRAYALERLNEAGEAMATQRRHARALSRHFDPAIGDEFVLSDREFVLRYESELDNLRIALHWALLHDAPAAVELVPHVAQLLNRLSLYDEGLAAIRAGQALLAADTPPLAAARTWNALERYARVLPLSRAQAAWRVAVAQYRLVDRRIELYLALCLGVGRGLPGDAAASQAALGEAAALEQPQWPPGQRCQRVLASSGEAYLRGDVVAAEQTLREGLRLLAGCGPTRSEVVARWNLVEMLLLQQRHDEAYDLAADLAERTRKLHCNAVPLSHCLHSLAMAHAALGRDAQARNALRESAALACPLGLVYLRADLMALLAARDGREADAARLIGYADARYRELEITREPVYVAAYEDARRHVVERLGQARSQTLIAEGEHIDAVEAIRIGFGEPG
ncbi:winged helix-turn-helix domain-containing protein [Aquincola sp. S2]|uniref:Winged helix-turn-helix domain-containing protein n=1 Tax=Pseudaquabacterium terrae TaxID=2732868 RepID=A0ABX2ETK8_9BURK|nr:winged helix-turn-helix domain-containing protein [Aquabacterium terrae]NRF71816.1 winged helix-turn-helix domain-containing protein [Aquabacterium terrae]